MNLNTFLQKYKGIYSSENKPRLLQKQLAALLKVEVLLHFCIKKALCSVTLNFASTLTVWVNFFMLCVWLWLNS